MTTIKSTIYGYSIDTLIAFLLGDVNGQTKAGIIEHADESQELKAYIQYLHRLLDTHDYDVARVTELAEQQLTVLVNELKKFNQELEEETIIEEQPMLFFTGHGDPPKHTPEGRTFSFIVSAHTDRLPTVPPLSIRGLQDAKSPLHVLAEDIRSELVRYPLDEKGMEHFLTVCRNQLRNRTMALTGNESVSHKPPSLWELTKMGCRLIFFRHGITPSDKGYSFEQPSTRNNKTSVVGRTGALF
jgi:hypothetical protein